MFITAPINNLSYGLVSRYTINEISKLTRTNTYPIGPVSFCEPLVANSINDLIDNPIDINSPSLKIWHQFDLFQHIGKGKRVGYTFFELDTLSKKDKTSLESQDLVLVASQWAKDIIESQARVECKVVNLGVNQYFFKPEDQRFSNKFVFLNIGKMEYRKGHDILLKAAEKVFEGKDDVVLWMMADNKFTDISKNVNEYKRTLGNKVAFIPPVQYHSQVSKVINSANCGVFPTRAEGFGMPISESLSCGLPIITTKYSAMLDYVPDKYTIEPDGSEIANDGIFFHGNGRWAKLGEKYLDSLISRMEDYYSLWKTGNLEYKKTFTRDWPQVATEIWNILN